MRGAIRLTALLALAASTPTFADSPDSRHFYAGVKLGQSSVDGRAQTDRTIAPAPLPGPVPSLPTELQINGLPFDDEDTSWSAFAGFQATQYVGVELGYWDHGTFEATRFIGLDTVSLDVEEIYFGATLRYPLTDRLSLTGSAGVSRARFDAQGTVNVLIGTFPLPPFFNPVLPPLPGPIIGLFPVTPVPVADPDDETGGYWQAGLSWRFSDSLEAAATFGKRDLQVQEIDTLAVSLSYNF
jgi:hypothetical protein